MVVWLRRGLSGGSDGDGENDSDDGRSYNVAQNGVIKS